MQKSFTQTVATEIGKFFLPLRQLNTAEELTDFLREIGWSICIGEVVNVDINKLSDLVDTVNAIAGIINDIENIEDEGDLLQLLLELNDEIPIVFECINNLFNGDLVLTISNLPCPEDIPYLAVDDLLRRISDYLIYEYFNRYHPNNLAAFNFLGLLDTETDGDEQTFKTVYWDRLGLVFANPRALFEQVYRWGNNNFDSNAFLERLLSFTNKVFLPGDFYVQPESIHGYLGRAEDDNLELRIPLYFTGVWPDDYIELNLNVSPMPGKGPESPGLFIYPATYGHFEVNEDLDDQWKFSLDLTGDLNMGFGLEIRPPAKLNITTDLLENISLVNDFDVKLTIEKAETSQQNNILIGSPSASNVFYKDLEWCVFIKKEGSNEANMGMEFSISKVGLQIKRGEGDGFLQKILPSEGIGFEFDLLFGYSLAKGFYIEGQSTLELGFIIDKEIGPIDLKSLLISLVPTESNFGIHFGSTFSTQLGPFTAVIEGVGLKAHLNYPSSSGGFSITDLDAGFKTPNGIGLALDADIITGGGYLAFYPEQHEYSGIAELSIKGIISLKAIGIINTQLPDGSDAYSFLLIITSEFTPIPLGFGFTLNGVGGLIAVNRSMDLDALREGIRTDAIGSIMFPDSPIAQAPQIINDLGDFFPILEGQYAFGIMGFIGWGTPTLLEIQLGLMLELPDPVRLAMLGVLKMEVAVDDWDILKLQINFLGTIDFEAEFITFDASLYDSNLLNFGLSGDIAFRLSWGNNPSFLLSAGGFHPDFEPPPLSLPAMRRMTVDIFKGDPRLCFKAYFAVTSNTLQMGAAVEFYMTVSNTLNVYLEGSMGFDALFRFSPFYMNIRIFASLAVKQNENTLLGISLAGQLEGPTPWHVLGEAEFKVLGIKFSPQFDITTGRKDNSRLPALKILPELIAALEDERNWKLLPPAGHTSLVTLRAIDLPEDEQIIHPLGSLGVSQEIIPLNIHLDKVGNQEPADYQEFELVLLDGNNQPMEGYNLREYFPAAQFIKMSDDEKISRKAFELFDAGAQATDSDGIDFKEYTEKEVQYDISSIIDDDNYADNDLAGTLTLVPSDSFIFTHGPNNGTIANSSFGRKAVAKKDAQPLQVKTKERRYAFASTSDLSRYTTFKAPSEAVAYQELQKVVAENPILENQLQVLPLDEIE